MCSRIRTAHIYSFGFTFMGHDGKKKGGEKN